MTTRDVRRAFTSTPKNEILEQQDHKCAVCHKRLNLTIVEFHHIRAWSASGKTLVKNGAALCPNCHKLKTHQDRLKKIENKSKNKKIEKTDSVKAKTSSNVLNLTDVISKQIQLQEKQKEARKRLNQLTLTQLKSLARENKVTIKGRIEENILWGSRKIAPTKQQYINGLLKVLVNK